MPVRGIRLVKFDHEIDGRRLALERRLTTDHGKKFLRRRVQMARELGMNPKKLGKLDNHDQEPWKLPLPEFIEKLYSKRFGKGRPDTVRSIEEMAAAKQAKQQAKRASKASISEPPANIRQRTS
jgi:hypothetical protein